jgi:hypothetical protein
MKTIAFDLDGCLCSRPKDTEHLGIKKYESCYPLVDMIEKVNSLYDAGYYIKIYTARGMTTLRGNVEMIYEKLGPVTKKHLKEWGVKYHDLIMGKEHYDVLIDDKCINSNSITISDIKKILND